MIPRSHYDVLGLPRAASTAEIKRSYRSLARQFHPDVDRSREAGQRFREINEAYRVLSDPARKQSYDSELILAERLRGAPSDPARAAESRARSSPPPPPPPPPRPAPSAQAQPLLDRAAAALRRRRLRDAEELARQALRIDRRSAAAYELLGDIYQLRGRIEDAISAYSYVLQLDRFRASAQGKFDRLTGQKTGPTMAGHAARASRRRAPTVVRSAGGAGTRPAQSTRALVAGLGAVLVASLVIIIGVNNADLAPTPLFFEWDPLLILSLIWAGLAAGFALALNGQLGSLREEPGAKAAGRFGRLQPALLLFAAPLLFFYAAFVVYALLGSVQGRLSRPILVAYAASFALVAIFAVVSHIGGLMVFLFAGNLVFPAFIAGWRISNHLAP